MLNFEELRKTNVGRCEESFFPLYEWSPCDWACAFAGKAGEVCNEVKKLRRLTTSFPRTSVTRAELTSYVDMNTKGIKDRIAKEVADTIIYADLLLARLGMSLEDAVRMKFNATSENVGSSKRL